MSKKKWKKKYKTLQKRYEHLWCEYIRLKSDNESIKVMTDEQILHVKEVLTNFGNNIRQALERINH